MTYEIPVWFQIGALVVLTLILIADLLIILKRPHIPSMKEATLWVVFYVALALVFAFVLYRVTDSPQAMGEFLAGWLTEYSLSIDNLFVFVLIMAQFAVPRRYQQEVLMVGIIIALILRAIFIMLGAALIEQFSWIFYIFGLFLVFTAWRQAFPKAHENDAQAEAGIVRFTRRFIDISDEYDGAKLRTVVDGKKIWTPMVLVFVAIGFTDLIFAIDSIPAIFGITQSPFIVFTANLFALMGLRQLYFLLGGLLDRLKYLHYGIAFILGLHRREALLPRPAHERAALHQRRRARPVGARDLDLHVARRDHPVDGGRHDREPRLVLAREEGADSGCRGRRRRRREGHAAHRRAAAGGRRQALTGAERSASAPGGSLAGCGSLAFSLAAATRPRSEPVLVAESFAGLIHLPRRTTEQ